MDLIRELFLTLCLQPLLPCSPVALFHLTPSHLTRAHLPPPLAGRRPISPDVFDINGGTHYAFPITAITSIINRGTGIVLSSGWTAMGILALTGDLPAAVDFVASSPALCALAKLGIAFPVSYHLIGGVRHLVWDHATLGNQAYKKSVLEKDTVPTSSSAVLGASIVMAAAMAVM